MTKLPTPSMDEKSARRRWVAFILGLFVAQVGLWVGAIAIVTGDRSHAVAADYDRAAVGWDDRRRAERASEATGWAATVEIDPLALEGDRHRISVRLNDALGRGVDGAEVELVLFHQARASEPQTLVLAPEVAGAYAGIAHMSQGGKWRVQIHATRGDERFGATGVHELHPESAG